MVRRHQALRTVFLDDSGSPRQRVLQYSGFTLSRHALAEVAPAERAGALRRFAAGEVSTPFDLGQGPLLRGALVDFGEQDHGLVLCLHHIASDGWSGSVLARELPRSTPTFAAGSRRRLPELPVQYADFAAWQRQLAPGEALERQLAFWRTRSPARRPPSSFRPTVRVLRSQSFRGGTPAASLRAERPTRLSALSRGAKGRRSS